MIKNTMRDNKVRSQRPKVAYKHTATVPYGSNVTEKTTNNMLLI